MKAVDTTNVQAAGDYKRPEPGAYICTLEKVEDVPDKEYLKITYDISEGEFAGYYSDMRANHPDWAWAGTYCRSYKEKALGMFKRFTNAVSKSNGNFVFDGNTINADEKTLAGKKIGLVFQEEEYYGNDGEKRTRLIINKEFPVGEIASQKVPKLKTIKDDDTSFNNVPAGSAEEVPF
jgi:hypothetical protein